MHILITGGTGLIGAHLIPMLLNRGHQITVVSRHPDTARKQFEGNIRLWSDLNQQQTLNGIDAIINLAGEPIASKRWSRRQKRRLCESRWQITDRLVSLIKASDTPPATLISASAAGYYGDTREQYCTEDDNGSDGFTHQLCARWEALALNAASEHTRVCLLRTGIVLSRNGGALKKMILPFRLGCGGPISNGRQYMAWIHLDDAISAISWLLNNSDLTGPFNLVAPAPIRNQQFAILLGAIMHRPVWLRIPGTIIRLIMGEMSTLLLDSQNLHPQRLENSGFQFQWREAKGALNNLLLPTQG